MDEKFLKSVNRDLYQMCTVNIIGTLRSNKTRISCREWTIHLLTDMNSNTYYTNLMLVFNLFVCTAYIGVLNKALINEYKPNGCANANNI